MTAAADRPLVGVGVVLLREDNLLMVRRGHDPGKGLWAVPGGKVEHGESLKAAAHREMVEETGLDVEVGDVVWVGEAIAGDYHIVLIDFAATLVGGELKAGDDAAEARWVPLSEAKEYPLTNTMYDLVDTLLA